MEQDNSDNNNTKEEDLELNDKLKAESVLGLIASYQN
ncbi:putative conjugative transfer TraB domain protein [Orientia tsutsugamushi str. UT76]|uniref:Putative conjugative transfer TraB domain protein n=1 Tax=Orientia tsutsugamushi str. UT144 TaxID=1441384 RepID=A0A0F3RKB8_ORITS|nr:putative conjugative transfer TraB domain protein [Orientia tsutsugamushi str. UT76]KJW06840.1 putative conjugative transfer TraB domain protein [Orientia tsutsugamushi str. UT144]